MNPELRAAIEILLKEDDNGASITDVVPLSGGNINEAYKVTATSKTVFIKVNDASHFPRMFEAEKTGLDLLRKYSGFKIPEVLFTGTLRDNSFLVLEFIRSGTNSVDAYETAGRLLAKLHRNSGTHFGLDHDNYIGSLPQSNKWHLSWTEFFVEERLAKQLKLAIDSKKAQSSLIRSFDKLYSRLSQLFPPEAPALLHGDLWSGNYMTTDKKEPCIYDPAVYYGHREMDMAMTSLFGGFSDDFYKGYNDEFPLENDWKNRIDLYNLYPLLVHVNLFCGSYLRQAENILKKYI